ncbi:MAG TPA: cytochrome P450 [Solirubrobacteraceae bacterium]|jgi:pulcherriminic acid synthase|nr:cytochrome P450 [Solirubrobacteraceae bacterium]
MSAPPAPPEPLSPQHIEDPFPGLEVLRDHYPIVWHDLTQSWLVSRYEAIRPILRDNKRWSTHHMKDLLNLYLGDAPTLTEMDGADHTHRRGLVAPYFAANGVARFRPVIERRARALLDPLLERERKALAAGERGRAEIDFVTEFSSIYPVDVIADMMALPERDYPRLQGWYNAWIRAVGNIGADPKIHERGLEAKVTFRDYILPLIAERRQGEGEDLISLLCRSELEGRSMTDEEIRSFLALIVLAGGETTDHQLGFIIHTLAQNPEQQRALIEDRSLMDKMLAEGLRYTAMVQFIQRTAREDIEVAGVMVTAGTKVTLMLAAGNRDPERWQCPAEFRPDRDDHDPAKAFTGGAEHVGFGGGRHLCLGTHLAKAEMAVALNRFLDHARDIRLADGFVAHAQPDAVFVRALPSVKITYEPV